MATIEEILEVADMKPEDIAGMSDEQLAEHLKDVLVLEPKALPPPLASKKLPVDKEDDGDDCPIKVRKPKKKKDANAVLLDALKFLEEI